MALLCLLLMVVGAASPFVIARWRTIFARQAFARASLARWARSSHVALHSASRAWFGQDPFPLEDSDQGLIFRIRATGPDSVVRDGWAYVPDHHRRETVQVIWDGGPPASVDCADGTSEIGAGKRASQS